MGVKRKINLDNSHNGARVRLSGNLTDTTTVEQAWALCHGMGRGVVRSNDSLGDRMKMSNCEAGKRSFQTCDLTEI